MEVFLYNSTVCRLCGEENDNGTLLYSCEENNQNLCEVINRFLPIKVSDDGQLPRTICPGCTIQLEATVEFLNLIINGQKVIRDLHQREKDYKKTFNAPSHDVITEKIVYEINTVDGVFHIEHPIALQVAGLERPRRKRGRPPKKSKSPEEIAQEAAAKEKELAAKNRREEDVSGKRRRKTPTRYREAVQGKDLDRILKEEGVTDGEESEPEVKPEVGAESQPRVLVKPEVIGHMEDSGELVVVVKGKGRGRPKGRMRPTREECAICGMEFSCVGRYMSHVAQHGPVIYQCGECTNAFATRLKFKQHQQDSGHSGQNVIPCEKVPEPLPDTEANTEPPTNSQEQDTDSTAKLTEYNSLPKLLPDLATKEEDPLTISSQEAQFLKSLVNEKTDMVPPKEIVPINADTNNKELLVTKGKTKLKCNHCDKLFNSKQSKSMHIKAVHKGERPYVCKECGCMFAYPRSLALHAISHRRQRSGTRRYACDLCGKVLNHPSSVVYHKEAEHAGQRYVCGKCGKLFKHKQLLQRHQLVHSQARPYSCKTCNASFKTKANLINHQLLHSGVKKFSCEICKQRFAHKTSLTLHMRWHTGSKPYVCKTCGKSFSQRGNLSEHERIHTGEKPYQCAQCPRRFTTSSQSRLHARRHQPDRPYACAHCPKRFVSRGSWAAHQKREAGLRAHQCTECARAFTERWALLKHMRRHTGERPFRCPHCPRTFADCSNLNKHKKQVHKQISLLVNDKNQPPPSSEPHAQQPSKLAPMPSKLAAAGAPDSEQDVDESVIYVTYDVNEPEPAFHILDPEQDAQVFPLKAHSCASDSWRNIIDKEVARLREIVKSSGPPTVQAALSSCELYSGPPVLVPQPELEDMPLGSEQFEQLESAELELGQSALVFSDDEHIEVTDEQGNPLHFTMQDGTRLAITSMDGKSLQVVTQDGQTIPVEINGYAEEEEEDVIVDMPESTVHQLNVQKESNASSPVMHYFTIV